MSDETKAQTVRAVLHDQAARSGHRPRARDGLRDRHADGRSDSRRERAGPWSRVHGVSAGRGRTGARAASVRPSRSAHRAPRQSCSSRMSRPYASWCASFSSGPAHTVIEAAMPKRRETLFEAMGAVDLLVTDVVMPGRSGLRAVPSAACEAAVASRALHLRLYRLRDVRRDDRRARSGVSREAVFSRGSGHQGPRGAESDPIGGFVGSTDAAD